MNAENVFQLVLGLCGNVTCILNIVSQGQIL
jgi:hypothetical protein